MLPYLPAGSNKRPDLVILLGARTGFLLGGTQPRHHSPDCKIAQIDIDGAEIGRSLPICLGIVSDANLFIDAFLSHTKQSQQPAPDRKPWLDTIATLISLSSPHASEPTTIAHDNNMLHPYHALKSVFGSIPPDSIILIDGGEAGVWAMELLEHAKPAHALSRPAYLGFLGNGWGYSLGAALAFPDKLVVNVQGDGSAGFHIAELDTYARHGLGVMTVVVNSELCLSRVTSSYFLGSAEKAMCSELTPLLTFTHLLDYYWGMSIAGQDLLYSTSEPTLRPVSTLSPACRFDIVAQGFGCEGVLVKDFDEIEGAVKKLADGATTGAKAKPGLINLIVSRQPVTATTKAMVGKTDEEGMIVVPYYDNVPRAYYKEGKGENGVVNGK